MSHSDSVQIVKEQLKLKTGELRREEKAKEKLELKLKNIIHYNKNKIFELQKTIQEKEQLYQEMNSEATAARLAKQAFKAQSSTENEQSKVKTSNFSNNYDESSIIKQLEDHKNRETSLLERLKVERQAYLQAFAEKTNLKTELNKIQAQLQEKKEKSKNRSTAKQSNNGQTANGSEPNELIRDQEKLLEEKNDLIDKYEQILYQTKPIDQDQGLLPSEIIHDLRMELHDLMEERKQMVLELDLLRNHNSELELKVSLNEEKDTTERLESTMNVDSRASVAAEFSSGLEGFLVTYSDMITLLLVIFILLFTISKVDEQKFAEALSSFQEKELRVDSHNVRLDHEEFQMLKRVKELVKDNVDPASLVRSDIHTILIRLDSSDLFAPGKSDLIPGANQSILSVVQLELKDGIKQVLIEGHTDNVPIKTSTFPSNWELSTARASRVARFLIDELQLPAEIFVVTGYGEFRPLKPNDSDHNRSLNRRVEIKILKDKEVFEEETSKVTE